MGRVIGFVPDINAVLLLQDGQEMLEDCGGGTIGEKSKALHTNTSEEKHGNKKIIINRDLRTKCFGHD